MTLSKYKIRMIYVVIFSLYNFPFMKNDLRVFQLGYSYFIPVLFLLLNISWVYNKIKYFSRRNHLVIFMCFAFVLFMAITYPIIMDTKDYSYLTSGSLAIMIKEFIKVFFLVLFYEKYVCKETAMSHSEFIDYYILSVCLYVIGTVIIVLTPSLHGFVVEHFTNDHAKRLFTYYSSVSYTRIGWSGFSNISPTFKCSLAVFLNGYLTITQPRNRKAFFRRITITIVLLTGNMLYGRTGLLISLVWLLFQLVIMTGMGVKDLKRVFCIIIVGLITALTLLEIGGMNDKTRNWIEWSTSFIRRFLEGEEMENSVLLHVAETTSIHSIIWGTGRYLSIELTTNHDPGWFRSCLYYGVFPTIVGYLMYFTSCKAFITVVATRNSQAMRMLVMVFLFIMLVCAEIKGEMYTIAVAAFTCISMICVKEKKETHEIYGEDSILC